MAIAAEVDGIVGEIPASAQEQASGLDQVDPAVSRMDQVTRQDAAMVEESTAASHALARETGELGRLMGAFRPSGEAAAAVHRAPVAPSGREAGREDFRATRSEARTGRDLIHPPGP